MSHETTRVRVRVIGLLNYKVATFVFISLSSSLKRDDDLPICSSTLPLYHQLLAGDITENCTAKADGMDGLFLIGELEPG